MRSFCPAFGWFFCGLPAKAGTTNFARHQADVMRLFNGITAKVLVWLAAILVPADALPLMACGCGSHAPGSACRADARPAAKCPHCNSTSRPQKSCCGSTAVASTEQGSCCGAKGSCCCCKGTLGSEGSLCLCAVKKSAPASAPLPGNSRTDNTKSVSTCSFGGLAAAMVLVRPTTPARADQQATLLCSSAPERLSILCRLVI
jgi:hypothetical protein